MDLDKRIDNLYTEIAMLSHERERMQLISTKQGYKKIYNQWLNIGLDPNAAYTITENEYIEYFNTSYYTSFEIFKNCINI